MIQKCERSVRDNAARQRKQGLALLAEEVLDKRVSVEQAALRGKCTPRTMYRWVKKVANDQI
jgi:transposase-like protein